MHAFMLKLIDIFHAIIIFVSLKTCYLMMIFKIRPLLVCMSVLIWIHNASFHLLHPSNIDIIPLIHIFSTKCCDVFTIHHYTLDYNILICQTGNTQERAL